MFSYYSQEQSNPVGNIKPFGNTTRYIHPVRKLFFFFFFVCDTFIDCVAGHMISHKAVPAVKLDSTTLAWMASVTW